MSKQYWCGEAPRVCQICDREIVGVFIDGKTQWDCWAFMCRDCWEMHGEGLGVGLGQMYGVQKDGRWLKLKTDDDIRATIEAIEDQVTSAVLMQIAVERAIRRAAK